MPPALAALLRSSGDSGWDETGVLPSAIAVVKEKLPDLVEERETQVLATDLACRDYLADALGSATLAEAAAKGDAFIRGSNLKINSRSRNSWRSGRSTENAQKNKPTPRSSIRNAAAKKERRGRRGHAQRDHGGEGREGRRERFRRANRRYRYGKIFEFAITGSRRDRRARERNSGENAHEEQADAVHRRKIDGPPRRPMPEKRAFRMLRLVALALDARARRACSRWMPRTPCRRRRASRAVSARDARLRAGLRVDHGDARVRARS